MFVVSLTLGYSWLKRLWATKSRDHEITQKEACSIIEKLKPNITPEDAKLIAKVGSEVKLHRWFLIRIIEHSL